MRHRVLAGPSAPQEPVPGIRRSQTEAHRDHPSNAGSDNSSSASLCDGILPHTKDLLYHSRRISPPGPVSRPIRSRFSSRIVMNRKTQPLPFARISSHCSPARAALGRFVLQDRENAIAHRSQQQSFSDQALRAPGSPDRPRPPGEIPEACARRTSGSYL